MKNRIIALLMVMVVVVLSFASCGLFGGKKDKDQGTGNKGDEGTGATGYPWTTTALKFQMTDNSNHDELPSSCRRYLAGDLSKTDDAAATVDDYIKDRNEAAQTATNVTVEYEYLPEADSASWSMNIDTIDAEVRAKDPARPDMYCNFVYDMVAVSLKGSFANLYSSTMHADGSGLEGEDHNYFEFTKLRDKYQDTGEGYMYEYMRSLTLSKYKMYCLSSDYFTDMVRAFLVVPVNIQLLETLQVNNDTEYLKDRVDTFDAQLNLKTNYTIEDFYALVKANLWTYETLAQFSEAITKDVGGTSDIDLNDIVGFALGTSSGLPASGMLYTTSITIIQRTMDAQKSEYTYAYPGTKNNGDNTFSMTAEGTPQNIIDFCNNLTNLMNTRGVITVSTGDASALGYEFDLQAIRASFASNKLLFGGVIALGSLEGDVYKEMNADGKKGYGIVPVPLYRSGSNDQYLTQIHNIGKIGAISYTTEKFSQCTAYLNYQSTHSTDILNEYYDYKLAYDVGTGVEGNVEMLQYIRYNVRSSFDKAFEDALAQFYSATDPDATGEKWHQMLMKANFKLETMATEYASVAPTKAWRLYNLENEIYPGLPD